MEIPNEAMTTTEKILSASGEIDVSFTKVERKSVKKVKLEINPTITPIGFL